MSRAIDAGVDRILAVGEDFASSRRAVALAAEHEMVYAAVGMHPHEADRFAAERGRIERLLNEDKVVAVGEIGLDWSHGAATRQGQHAAFREQLHWAAERDLPVSVHNRGADTDILEALNDVPVRAVMHCFDGTQEFAEQLLAADHFLSFAGNLTFKRADTLRATARHVPADRMLIETDSPVLAPQGWRGTRNEPAHIVEVAALLASLRGVAVEALSRQLSRNADAVFRWSAS